MGRSKVRWLGWAIMGSGFLSWAALADDTAGPAAAECGAAATRLEEGTILPTTGLIFTLPPAADNEPDPCQNLPPPPVRPAPPNIFGTIALPVKSTTMSLRWDAARELDPGTMLATWREAAAQASALRGETQLAFVNNWVNNHVAFIEDGEGDHWASAAETARAGQGDCEDFAIAKLGLLRAAGVSPDSLFLVIVRDTVRGRDHAVLAVHYKDGMIVLDSRTDRILPSSAITDYQPVFSFEGPFAWMHGYKASVGPMPLPRMNPPAESVSREGGQVPGV